VIKKGVEVSRLVSNKSQSVARMPDGSEFQTAVAAVCVCSGQLSLLSYAVRFRDELVDES